MTGLVKILVVEDDALIAMELEERLVELGHTVLGPALTLEAAETLASQDRPYAALLDANLAGKSSVDLGAALFAQGVRVAFCTGYDKIKNLPPELEGVMVLTKPLSDADLQAGLKKLLA
jgi:DNA-binding response OmpR family regulator